MSYENLDWLMGVNFWGVVQGSMAFLPLLKKSPQGHLVNISSIFGMIAVPTQSAYNAAQILQALEKQKPRLLIGLDAKIVSLVSRLFPVRYPQILRLHKLVE